MTIGANQIVFQSTQPKRAATWIINLEMVDQSISIHAAQEGCDRKPTLDVDVAAEISIHAAQEGCDLVQVTLLLDRYGFQSTQPKRAATLYYRL